MLFFGPQEAQCRTVAALSIRVKTLTIPTAMRVVVEHEANRPVIENDCLNQLLADEVLNPCLRRPMCFCLMGKPAKPVRKAT